ncbi:hypothetical protein [Tenacibaculum sp. IB213877]|uniref:hypothetical protein n=1 Tax=Tenacibaculum sp. IB213877 TaxID=3097351 RepID=UPI002A59B55E|nr:hypothetical protein [Tenacibaculum sp. IB213877]MDY0780314.1 hypothetical protein [Tenacibaculum sp. IB213877]
MFTTGRIIFAAFFVIVFTVLMVYSYKKDATNNQKHYQNAAFYVAIGIIAVIALLFLSKYLIKH